MEQKETLSANVLSAIDHEFYFNKEEFNIQFQDNIAQIQDAWEKLDVAKESLRQITKVRNILIDHQVVYWDYFDSEFMRNILDSGNIEKCIAELLGKNSSKNLKKQINACIQSIESKTKKALFSESIFAFNKGKYFLCVVGLVAILDYLLSQSSGSTEIGIKNRVKLIERKIVDGFKLNSSELSEILLCSTFSSVIVSLSESKDFGGSEPQKLNRHWIMHGRSNREYSAFDCIKLIRIIYALLIINDAI